MLWRFNIILEGYIWDTFKPTLKHDTTMKQTTWIQLVPFNGKFAEKGARKKSNAHFLVKTFEALQYADGEFAFSLRQFAGFEQLTQEEVGQLMGGN